MKSSLLIPAQCASRKRFMLTFMPLILAALSTSISAQTAGTIITYAGTFSQYGFGGDGGPATSALLNPDPNPEPSEIASDSHGNIYLCDNGNYRIRKVDAATGIISTYAGNGTGDVSGDGGPAIDAGVGPPNAIATDASDNLYIWERGFPDSTIRKVDAQTGVINTIATISEQRYGAVGGLAVSPSGDSAYFYSPTAAAVYQVALKSGAVYVFAGTPNVHGDSGDGGPATSAELNFPVSIATDKGGDLYILDPGLGGPSALREVNTAGIISTVASNTLGASSIAVDQAGDVFLGYNGFVAKVKAGTGKLTCVVGTGPPPPLYQQFVDGSCAVDVRASPGSLALDNSGNLYIFDQYSGPHCQDHFSPAIS